MVREWIRRTPAATTSRGPQQRVMGPRIVILHELVGLSDNRSTRLSLVFSQDSRGNQPSDESLVRDLGHWLYEVNGLSESHRGFLPPLWPFRYHYRISAFIIVFHLRRRRRDEGLREVQNLVPNRTAYIHRRGHLRTRSGADSVVSLPNEEHEHDTGNVK